MSLLLLELTHVPNLYVRGHLTGKMYGILIREQTIPKVVLASACIVGGLAVECPEFLQCALGALRTAAKVPPRSTRAMN